MPSSAHVNRRQTARARGRRGADPRRREDQRLQRRQRHGDRRARAELAERYLPLAQKLALRYRNSREPLEDLVQVASLGLTKALERWDPERGTAFSTFAVPTILGELRRHFRDNTWAVKPPRGTQELWLLVAATRDRLWHELGRDPTVGELADALGRSREDVLDALHAGGAQRAQSLDAPLAEGNDEQINQLELLGSADPGYATVESGLMLEDLSAILDERAREVLRLRFHDDLLQREIAERIGCAQMHVSRILRAALDTLRHHAERHARTTTDPRRDG